MRVVKFGGSSLSDVTRLRATAAIVDELRRHGPVSVVVSAMAGVTDALLSAAEDGLAQRPDWADRLRDVRQRHLEVHHNLQAALGDFERHWAAIAHEAEALLLVGAALDPAHRALVAARFSGWGERLATSAVVAALSERGVNAYGLDDAPVLLSTREATDSVPEPSVLATRSWLLPRLAMPVMRGAVPVLPGYIARDAVGRLTTLGRNGSDFSASVIAAALGARRLTIYSDVTGIYSADPRVAPDAELLPTLTYGEAMWIAQLGAKALHPRAIEPLTRGTIPLELRSSYIPNSPGTAVGAAERLTRAHTRDARWVVVSRMATTGRAIISSARLPAWPHEHASSVYDAMRWGLGVILRSGLAHDGLACDSDLIQFSVAAESAGETVRKIHQSLNNSAADREPARRVASGA